MSVAGLEREESTVYGNFETWITSTKESVGHLLVSGLRISRGPVSPLPGEVHEVQLERDNDRQTSLCILEIIFAPVLQTIKKGKYSIL